MARVVNPVIGNVTGKAGTTTFFIKEGETYFRSSPDRYNIKSEKLKAAQGKFGLINKFVSEVYKAPLIASTIKKASLKKTWAYNYLVSLNSDKFLNNRPTKRNLITPPGTICPISELCYRSGKIHVKLLQETPGSIVLIIVGVNPLTSTAPDFEVFPAEEMEIPAVEFEVTANVAIVNKIKNYSDYIIYGAVIDEESWTNTIAFEGKVED